MTSSATGTDVIPWLYMALFPAVWLAVGALLSGLSGWSAIPRRYPGARRPAGPRLRGQVYGIGMVHETNVTGLIVTAAGLYLYSNPLFRFRRPPALVPWASIRCVHTHRLLRRRWYTLDLAGVTTMRVGERAWKVIAPRLTTGDRALLPNEALQLSGMQGRPGAALGSILPRLRRSPKARS